MSKIEISPYVVNRLRGIRNRILSEQGEAGDTEGRKVLAAKQRVLDHYGKVFALSNISKLSADEFLAFLKYKNNCHWEGLHRRGQDIVADMKGLRKSLAALLDESQPVAARLDRVLDGADKVPFMGRAIVTAILLVVYPDRYVVWNRKSEDGMRALGLWPDTANASRGRQYERINAIAIATAAALEVDLWTLDCLWWRVVGTLGENPAGDALAVEPVGETETMRIGSSVFALEGHLHEFLEANWESTELGREWDLLEEDGEIVGSHYRTEEVGVIDLLARHKKDSRWLVIELKRNQTSDATVGQILRYMAWVREKRAKPGEKVEGLIICRDADLKLRYALAELPNIRCKSYEVNFKIRPTTCDV
ncbi:MAG: hypothetical protein DCC65_17215 [Planctomycetota bacterium]|nr:MAG: hypothetical protein DCC65_17215 [Planctomycetota bacterium]